MLDLMKYVLAEYKVIKVADDFVSAYIEGNDAYNEGFGSRKTVMGLAAALTMVAPLTVVASTAEMAIVFMSLIMFAHGFWITNYITITSELFGKNATITVVGMSGSAGAIAGLLVNPLIGKIVEGYSYMPMWIASGIMYPLGFIILVLTIRNVAPLSL